MAIIEPLAPRTPKGLTPLQRARLLRGAAVDKKAWDAVVIDVRDKTSIADYFVVCEGETDRQVKAIADGIVERAREHGVRPLAVDGYDARAALGEQLDGRTADDAGSASHDGDLAVQANTVGHGFSFGGPRWLRLSRMVWGGRGRAARSIE